MKRKILRFSAEQIKTFFTEGEHHYNITQGLPDDAIFIAAEDNPSTGDIIMSFASSNFGDSREANVFEWMGFQKEDLEC